MSYPEVDGVGLHTPEERGAVGGTLSLVSSTRLPRWVEKGVVLDPGDGFTDMVLTSGDGFTDMALDPGDGFTEWVSDGTRTVKLSFHKRRKKDLQISIHPYGAFLCPSLPCSFRSGRWYWS